MKLYMCRTVRLSIIRSLYPVHLAMVHVIQLSTNLYDIRVYHLFTVHSAECTVNKFLMMDRGAVRNMYSFMTKYICEISACSRFYDKEPKRRLQMFSLCIS